MFDLDIRNYKKVKREAIEVKKMQDHDLKADEDSTQGLLSLTKILSDYGATKLLKVTIVLLFFFTS